jgi:hypothetical protein
VLPMFAHPWMLLLHDGPGQDVPDASGGTVPWISLRLVPLGWHVIPVGPIGMLALRTWVGWLGFGPATGH